MDKIDIKQLFEQKQNEMLAKFNLGNGFSHPVSKGDATEKEWRTWFNSFFPNRYSAEKAFVIDCQGNCSEQIDVVIYDTHFSPTIFEYNNEKYIPAESVYAVFEVKQNLNKEHLNYASTKVESVKKLIRTSAPINTIKGFMPGRLPVPILGGLLTLRCDWEKNNIQKNIENNLQEIVKNENHSIDFICCLSIFACAIESNFVKSNFLGKEIIFPNFEIFNNGDNSPLIYTYFKLLRMLQDMGNVPAIEFSKYGIEGIEPNIK